MMLPLAILGLGAAGLEAASRVDQPKPVMPSQRELVLESLRDASRISVPPIERWAEVTHEGVLYKVSPIYIAPVGIGEAVRVAKLHNSILPTPELVTAIWKAADLKVEPIPRSHDGTPKTMNSDDMNISQLAKIDNQIVTQFPNRNFRLLAGSHKDVVMKNGKIGIFGWHRLNGKPIQDFFTGHAHGDTPQTDWKDYSQGLRLVRRVS